MRLADTPTLVRDLLRVSRHHRRIHGRLPHFWSQSCFTDLIAYRKVFPHPIYSQLTDKLLVRDFVANRVGERYLVPLLAETDDMAGFDFGRLPSAFVMKGSHGSGWVELVWDKDKADIEALRRRATEWLGQSYHAKHSERQYLPLKPRIVFEQLLSQNGEAARDYKVNCFRRNGQLTRIYEVHASRFGGHRAAFLDETWRRIDLGWGAAPARADDLAPPPELAELTAVAERLSEGFNFVRVDLYAVEGRVYLGELTFTPGAGLQRFDPPGYDRAWGDLYDRERPWQRLPAYPGEASAWDWRLSAEAAGAAPMAAGAQPEAGEQAAAGVDERAAAAGEREPVGRAA